MQQIQGLPLWIKQVIFVQMRKDLEQILTKSTIDTFGESEILQSMLPQLNTLGKQEVDRPSGQVSTEVMKILYWANQNKSVMNICVLNQWTLEQCCTHLFSAIEKGFVLPPSSIMTQATLLYLGNKIRLGDFLVKTGRLKLEQLDQALRTQRYIEESLGERTGIGNIFINLGYIQKQDCEGILFLKEECKKPFPDSFFAENGPQAPTTPAAVPIDSQTVARLQADLREANDRIRELERQLETPTEPQKQKWPF